MTELTLITGDNYSQWIDADGVPHSPDNETPAIWAHDGSFKMWYHHGVFHRMYGLPAVIYDRKEDDDRNEYWFLGWRNRYREYGPAMHFLNQPQNNIWFEWEVPYDKDGNPIPIEYEVTPPTFLGDYTDDELGKNGPIYPTPTPTPEATPEETPEETPAVAAKRTTRKKA